MKKKRSHRLSVALLSLAALIAGCGGGGGDDPLTVACSKAQTTLRAGSFDQGFQGGEGDGTGAGSDGSGDAGDAGGNGGDAGGNEGQFRNVRVEVRNRNMELVAEGMVDNDTGMVNLKLDRSCKGEPIEIKFVGGPGAEYYDEVTRQFEPYPAGKQLRVRLSSFARNVSANAYTEAAAQLMDAEAGGETRLLEATKIDTANQRVAALAKDQLPGIYREPTGAPVGAKGAEINRITKPINPQTISQPGSYADDANGRLAAALAGLGGAGNTVGAASRINEFFAADMADGKLDLQGVAPGGTQPLIQLRTDASGAVVVSEAIPYTYETLWRANSSSTGAVATVAGDQGLKEATRQTEIARYFSTLREVYRMERIQHPPPGEAYSFNTGSEGTQAVRLYADGRLTLRRTMTAGFSASKWYTNSPAVASEFPVDSPGGKGFVDVRVGSRADVLALTRDRTQLVYVKPYKLYIVNGNEFPENVGQNVELLDTAVRTVDRVTISLPLSRSTSRIVGFVPGPERRAYPGRDKPPAILMLLTDGSLWGVDPDQPQAPFVIPIPEPMLQVVFDRFVAPTYTAPGYGQGGNLTTVATPANRGNRRLFGLTTRGTVKTWIEGLAATGHELAIPGKVVMLSAESKTNVYALTSDRQVFWINADQALADYPEELIAPPGSIAAYRRRHPLHQVVPVDLGGAAACWVARSEAVVCDSGPVRQWTESVKPILFADRPGAQNDRVLMPTTISASAAVTAPGYWRINAVDEEFVLTDADSRFAIGATYLPVNGLPLDAGAAQGKRNVREDLLLLPNGNRAAAVEGQRLVAALNSVFRPDSPLQMPRVLKSVVSWNKQVHSLTVSMTNPASNQYVLSLSSDSGGDPIAKRNMPDISLAIDAVTSASSATVNVRQLTGDDVRDPPGSGLTGPALQFGAGQNYELHRFFARWSGTYRDKFTAGTDQPYATVILRDTSSDPYVFRICFAMLYQVRPSAPAGALPSTDGMDICTVHESDGRFRNLTADSGWSFHPNDGFLHDVDWGNQTYSPY